MCVLCPGNTPLCSPSIDITLIETCASRKVTNRTNVRAQPQLFRYFSRTFFLSSPFKSISHSIITIFQEKKKMSRQRLGSLTRQILCVVCEGHTRGNFSCDFVCVVSQSSIYFSPVVVATTDRQTDRRRSYILYLYVYLFLMAVFDIFFTCLKTIERKDRKGLFF